MSSLWATKGSQFGRFWKAGRPLQWLMMGYGVGLTGWGIAKAEEQQKKSLFDRRVGFSDPIVLHTERPGAKRPTANFHAEPVLFSLAPVPGTSVQRVWYQVPSGSNHQGPASNKMPWRGDICTNLLDCKELCISVILGKDAFHNQLAFLLSNSVQWVDYIFKSLF